MLAAIQTAASRTGSDFQYLLGTAIRESSLNATARANTSSATGLYQFTGQTWLATVKAHGAEYGLGNYAAAIHQNANGHYAVDSPEVKNQILALRNDPQIAAYMAGEAAEDIRQNLESALCRPVSCGELYAAHFLGEGGARKLIAAKEADPNASAAAAFPDAARANRRVFYHSNGTPKSVAEVYSWATNMPDAAKAAGAQAAPSQSVASAALIDPTGAATASTRAYVPTAAKMTNAGMMSLLPSSPLALMPGVIEILASLDPSPMSGRDDAIN